MTACDGVIVPQHRHGHKEDGASHAAGAFAVWALQDVIVQRFMLCDMGRLRRLEARVLLAGVER